MSHRLLRKIFILIFWIIVWQLASIMIHNVILLVGPLEVLRALTRMAVTEEFWRSVLHSLSHIALGFAGGLVSGVLFGSLAFRFRLVHEFLEPVILLIKSIPVASFVILTLIWVGSGSLSVLISFLVVFPMIYVNTIAGLKSTDVKLLEMADVFGVKPGGRIRCIYLPALRPYLISSCEIALGMSWKSGVAAEVIGIPSHSIGERLYMAKIYLETGDVLAWTLVIIVISSIFEKSILALLRRGKGAGVC